MENTFINIATPHPLPQGSDIELKTSGNQTLVTIPAKGYKGKGLITLVVIILWMVTILVWSLLLLTMNPLYTLYSIPLWLIGIFSLIKSKKIITLEQQVTISAESIELNLKQGTKTDSRKFPLNKVSVSLVEGSYHSLSGLSRRGSYPAIIFEDTAFGFAERSSFEEKQWLINTINNVINHASK